MAHGGIPTASTAQMSAAMGASPVLKFGVPVWVGLGTQLVRLLARSVPGWR